MAYEQKPGDGIIFKNNKKQSDKHPDYTGNFLGLDGKKYGVALWIKEGQKGKFFSFKQSEWREQQGSIDDLPF